MAGIRCVAVFCGSRVGSNPAFAEAASALGTGLAEAGIEVIYGGGRIGLMGVVADAAVAAGGLVRGVIPDFLRRREVAHAGVTSMQVTDSMHSRKQRMFELADAFVAMPGGIGTIDETIEVLTWRQLQLHDKPILICDVAGSAQGILAAIDATIKLGFTEPEIRDKFEVVDGVAELLLRLRALPAPIGVTGERL